MTWCCVKIRKAVLWEPKGVYPGRSPSRLTPRRTGEEDLFRHQARQPLRDPKKCLATNKKSIRCLKLFSFSNGDGGDGIPSSPAISLISNLVAFVRGSATDHGNLDDQCATNYASKVPAQPSWMRRFTFLKRFFQSKTANVGFSARLGVVVKPGPSSFRG